MENLDLSWLIPTFLQVISIAIALTVVGFGYECAIRERKPSINEMTQAKYTKWYALAGVVFAVGLYFTQMAWIYKIIAIALAGLLTVLAVASPESELSDEPETAKQNQTK